MSAGDLVPYALFVALMAVAGLHAYWARGGAWPAKDANQLADWVIGEAFRTGMPPASAIWLVVASLVFAAFDALAMAAQYSDPWERLVVWTGAGLCGVFGIRGVAGYTPFWRAAHPGAAFTWMDKRFYSPFCILIAEGFFTLVSGRI